MNFKDFISTLITEDFFAIFLIIMSMILLVLIMAVLKTRKQYLTIYENIDEDETVETEEYDDAMMLFESLISKDLEEETVPAANSDIKEDIRFDIPIPIEQTYSNIIEDYENDEEEHAVISTSELERRTQERKEEMGVSSNQAMIDKYKEEQERKAIISYEQLLKNASNITITYKEEKTVAGAPKINRIEVQEKVVTEPQCYLDEEQFLKILKEFRLTLWKNF